MPVHQMEATDLVTGDVLLICPTCGCRVLIDGATQTSKTLEWGDAATVQHGWVRGGGGVGLSISGSKTAPPTGGNAPAGPSCAM